MILEMSFQQCRPCPAETGKVGHAHLLQHFGFLSALLPPELAACSHVCFFNNQLPCPDGIPYRPKMWDVPAALVPQISSLG